MSSRYKSLLLVIIQFACLIYLFVSAPIVARSIGGALCQLAGTLIGLWAIWRMKPGNFNIQPEVKHGAVLVTNGPYRWVRHPMYLSLLLITIPLGVAYPSEIRLIVLIIFTVNMIIKMLYEEKLLLTIFPEYADYQKHSKKLIPFIW